MSLPTYQTESENEQLLLSEQTVSTESGFMSSFNTRVGAAALIVGMMIATVAIRTQLFPTTNSQSPLMKSGVPIMREFAPEFSIDSPIAPVTLSTFAKKAGIVRALFDKYGMNVQPLSPEDKMLKAIMTEANKHPVAPRTQPTKEGVKGDPYYWVIASQYTGSTCKGSVNSVAAFAGATCIPVSMTDGTKAFSMVCSSSNNVVMNMYQDQDCSGLVTTSAIIGTTNNCTSTAVASNTTIATSTIFTCGTPALSGYDEQSFYAVPGTGTSATKYDDDAAQSWCWWDSSLSYDGDLIEAYPTGLCIPLTTTSSMQYAVDAGLQPSYTQYSGSMNCASGATSSVTYNLDTTCQTQQLQQNVSVKAKWYYRL